MFKIGFIDYYLDEWHANNYPRFITECVGEELKVAYAYGMIASPKSGKTSAEWCEEMGVLLCGSIEELVEKSDGIVVLSPDNPEMKEELSELALKSGKPVFVDKTFTTGYESAKRMMDTAEKHGTPMYTSSALRYAPDYDEIDGTDVTAINCIGPNDLNNYSIHMLEPMMKIMRTDASEVMYTEAEGYYSINIRFVDGRAGSVSGYMDKRFPFMIAYAGKNATKVAHATAPFWPVFTKGLCDFFLKGEIKVDPRESMAIMAIRTAAYEAKKTPGEWVKVENRGF